MKKTLLFLILAGLFFIGCQPAGQQEEAAGDAATEEKVYEDITKAPDSEAELLLANEYARVLLITLAPGEKQPPHQGGNRTVYSLSDYTLAWTEGESEPVTKQWKAGDVHWHAAGIHRAENKGEAAASYLVVERTEKALPECDLSDLNADVNQARPENARQLFDNEYARVTQVTLAPGENTPEHAGINRVIYALTDYTLAYTSEAEAETEKTFTAGDTHWHEACWHSVANTGEGTAQFLVFALKK